MQKINLILILLISLSSSAQKISDIFFSEFVECYYSNKETEPICVYEKPNGKIITELSPLTESHCWYKFAISDSKNGWLKIENLIVAPGCRENKLNENIKLYKDKWILANKMKINISDLDVKPENGVKFYKNANSKSDLVHRAGKFIETKLIEINGLWAKVSFLVDENRIIGWLERKDQCAYPWTSCPYNPN